jgi:ABC-type phosphate transport system substrate-binding protein
MEVLLRRGLVVVALLLALVPPRVGRGEGSGGYVVVVNASNEITEMPQDLVARMFLRKVRKWRSGQTTSPVDQSLASPVRIVFSKDVLGMSIGEIRDYWMKQTLSGADVPPSVRSSDLEVLEIVKAEPGAIGYVTAGAKLPAEVKAVKVTQ